MNPFSPNPPLSRTNSPRLSGLAAARAESLLTGPSGRYLVAGHFLDKRQDGGDRQTPARGPGAPAALRDGLPGTPRANRRASQRLNPTDESWLLAAAAINRYSSLFEHVTYSHLQTDRLQAAVSKILSSAVHDGKGFTLAYFHRAEELVEEMRDAGLIDVEVFGVEGPAWSLLKAVEQSGGTPSEEMFASALTAARMAEPYPELLAASSHLLALGRVPEGSQ